MKGFAPGGLHLDVRECYYNLAGMELSPPGTNDRTVGMLRSFLTFTCYWSQGSSTKEKKRKGKGTIRGASDDEREVLTMVSEWEEEKCQNNRRRQWFVGRERGGREAPDAWTSDMHAAHHAQPFSSLFSNNLGMHYFVLSMYKERISIAYY